MSRTVGAKVVDMKDKKEISLAIRRQAQAGSQLVCFCASQS